MSLGALLPRTERGEAVFHPYARRQTRRRVYSPRTEESYRLPSRTTTAPGGCSLCFDFVYYSGIGPSSRRRAAAGSVLVRFLFFPATHPPLAPGSHSIRRSRSVVTALRLYKFYIIFMRHKVVEKPAEEGRERVRTERERSASEGKSLSVRISSLSHPFRPRQLPF